MLPRTFSRLPVLVGPGRELADFAAVALGRSGDPRDELVLLGLEGIPEDTRGLSEESSRDPVLPSDVWLSDFLTLAVDTFLGGEDFSAVPFNLVPLLCLAGPAGVVRSSPDFSRRGRSSPDFSRRMP